MKNLNKKVITTAVSFSLFMLTACNANADLKGDETNKITQTDTAQVQSTDEKSYSYSNRDKSGSWDKNVAVKINLSNYKVGSLGSGVEAKNNNIKITQAGTYVLEGKLKNGQIIVDAKDTDKIQLVLNNADIKCDYSAPIYVKNADKVFLTLADGSSNVVSDGESHSNLEDEANATIFSNDDLTINGSGKLDIDANFENGIKSDDTIVITGGEITINSKENAIVGKDEVAILNGKFKIVSGKDAIKSNNETDLDKGNVIIDGGEFNIEAVDDGIEAQRVLTISNNPKITISKSNEGLEGENIYINGGILDINSEDDGINASSPDDSGKCNLVISGGQIVVDAKGDGIDSNGDFLVEGGTTLVYGPTNGGNGSVDYDGEGKINGGTFVAIGSAGMYQGFSESSKQASISVTYTAEQKSGNQLSLTDTDGNIIASFKAEKDYQSVLISSPKIKEGNKYKLYSQESGDDTKVLKTEGKIENKKAIVEITASANSTNVNEKGEAINLRNNGPGGAGGFARPGGKGGKGEFIPPEGSDKFNRGNNPPPKINNHVKNKNS